MVLAAGVGLHLAAAVLGLAGGIAAVYLAQQIPPRMGVDDRHRPQVWWGAAVIVGGGYGWLAASVAGWSLLPALLAFGTVTLALALIDLDHQLIPNRVLFPGMLVAGVLLAVGAIIDANLGGLGRGLVAAGSYFLFLLVVALIAKGGFGMGDVKLALLLGLFLGYFGWDEVGVGLILAILLGGVVSVLLLLMGNRGRKSKFAYGPFLVGGAWVALFWGQEIADWYLRRG